MRLTCIALLAFILCAIQQLPCGPNSAKGTPLHAEELHFKVSSDFSCRKTIMSNAWLSDSWITCIAKCKCLLADRCRNVMFNSQTLRCQPVSPLVSSGQTSMVHPGDVLYSQQDKVPGCDAARGFVLHNRCGAFMCVFLSSVKLGYAGAKSECFSRNGALISANSFKRYALLLHLRSRVAGDLMVGLTRQFGSFYWENGEHLEPDQASYVWSAGEPNNGLGNENCAVAVGTQDQGFMDIPCEWAYHFVCEQNQNV